ncbi:MAG: cupin domain-containing protein [Pseudomonadota bacterium]
MTRKPVWLKRDDWAQAEDAWRGRVEGADLDTQITVFFFSSDEIGAGPVLHKHPYDEMFIVRAGRARFTVGDRKIDAEAGDILMAPAEMAHKFESLGPGRLETTDLHLSPRFVQTDLEGENAG